MDVEHKNPKKELGPKFSQRPHPFFLCVVSAFLAETFWWNQCLDSWWFRGSMLVSLSCLAPVHCVGNKVLKQISYFIQILQARKHLITCTQNKFHSSQLLNFFFFFLFFSLQYHFISFVLLYFYCAWTILEKQYLNMMRTHQPTTHFNYQTDSNHTNAYNTLIKKLCNSTQAAYSKLILLKTVPVDIQSTLSKEATGFLSFWFNWDISWVFLGELLPSM